MSIVFEEVFESGPVLMAGDYLSFSVIGKEWKAEKSSKTLDPSDDEVLQT